jgi:CRISPR/Cas system-associated endoribonuclease Cas2
LNKDGAFRKGGVVQNVWLQKDKDGQEVVKIEVLAGYGPKTTKWSITNTKVEKIWVKEGLQRIQTNTGVSELKEDIEYCKASIQQLKKEIQKINNDQARLIEIVRKKL